MLPTYRPGEKVTAFRRWRRVRVGDIVVLHNPLVDGGWMLKRCVATSGCMLDLRGDNAPGSTDSRDFGLVSSRAVTYLVVDPRSAARTP
jgi:hypothetical protein